MGEGAAGGKTNVEEWKGGRNGEDAKGSEGEWGMETLSWLYSKLPPAAPSKAELFY